VQRRVLWSAAVLHLPQERWEKPQVCVYYRGLSLAIQDRTGRQFAASDKVGNAWAVDGVGREADGFGDSQTGRVTDDEDHAVLQIVNDRKEACQLVLADHHGSFFACLPAGMSSSAAGRTLARVPAPLADRAGTLHDDDIRLPSGGSLPFRQAACAFKKCASREQ
jgi:hypothetical protein